LREGLKQIHTELREHFAEIDQDEVYGKQMWAFYKKATVQVDDVTDDINAADSTFNEVLRYYGEEDKGMTSSEFFGIFKTFVTSYRVSCRTGHPCPFNSMLTMFIFRACDRNARWTIKLPLKNVPQLRSVNKPPKCNEPIVKRPWKRQQTTRIMMH